MKRFLTVLPVAFALALPIATPAPAQSTSTTTANPRLIYSEARAEMDTLIMARRMGDAIRMFEGLGVPTNKELAAIDTKLRVLYKEDFEKVALVKSEVHKNGFRQEMIAYWTGQQYLYVYLLIHTDDHQPRLLKFQFGSSFEAISQLF